MKSMLINIMTPFEIFLAKSEIKKNIMAWLIISARIRNNKEIFFTLIILLKLIFVFIFKIILQVKV